MMNPELRRNLWLEITPHRLLAMPVVLGLAFLALSAINRENAIETVSWTALAGFGVLTILWGTRLAANSILDEMADKTWDWQRLSILSPWTMTWGKLLGATAFAWYGGLVCLAVFLATAQATSIASPAKVALIALLLAVMLQASGIAAALHISRKGVPQHRRSVGFLVIIVVLYVVPFVMTQGIESAKPVSWYGMTFDGANFSLVSAALFAVWAVTGAWRAMCQGLAVRTTPLLWLLFLLCVSVYSAGFAGIGSGFSALHAVLLSLMLWSLGLTYMMLFTEPTSPVVVRRVLRKLDLKQWRRAAEEVPCWPLTWLVAAGSAIAFALLGAGAEPSTFLREWASTPIPLTLLAARDAGLLMLFLAAPNPKRAEATTLVYMLVLYWVLPGLLYAVDLAVVANLVLPLGSGNTWLQIPVALAQAVVVWWFAWQRVGQRLASTRRADGG